jgi:hypothetical protein
LGNDGFMAFTVRTDASGFVEAARINETADLKINTGNLVIGTSGKGIDFSATPSTGTSELLNDYEEGTWTPVFRGDSTAGTYTYSSVQAGLYTKVGRMVVASCTMYNIGVTSAGTGGIQVSGLPFTPSTDTALQRALSFVSRMRNFSTSRSNIIAVVDGTSIYISYDNNGTGGGTAYPVTDVTDGSSQIGFTVTYFV